MYHTEESSINSVNELLNVIFKLHLLAVKIDESSSNRNTQRKFFDNYLLIIILLKNARYSCIKVKVYE